MSSLPIIDSLNKFGIELLQKINQNKNQNVVFSPYSAFACLSMLPSLFTNQTRNEILKSLQIPNEAKVQIDSFLKQVRELYDKEKTEFVSSSNRVWANGKLNFSPETFAPNSKILGVPIEKVIFPQPGCDKINEDINKTTQGMIPKIIEPSDIPVNCAIVLTNAIFFKSRWDEIFVEDPSSKNASSKNFILSDGKQIHVHMMESTERQLLYYENKMFQLVCIPYLHHKYDFVVILPKDKSNNGYQNLTKLNYDQINNEMLKNAKIKVVDLKLPKFEIESQMNLNDILMSLGMKKVFSPDADCSDPKVKYFVSLVLQRAKISVDENGTVASAATMAMMEEGACEIGGEPVDFFADHPFAYILRNKRSKSFIFEGIVKNPSE